MSIFEKVAELTKPISCERCNRLARQKNALLDENHELKQRLIDAGLENAPIKTDLSRKA